MAKRATQTAAVSAEIVTYKGFGADWKCRDYQYEVGGTYKHDGRVVRCAEGGFHSCEMPLDVFNYYGPATSKLALTVAAGDIDREENSDTKIASGEITIKAELKLPEFIKKAVSWIVDKAGESVTTGYRAHAASTGNGAHAASTGNGAHAASTGDYAHAASTGYRAHAASTGDYAHAASTGYRAHAASTGYRAHAASTGNGALSAALGARSTASAGEGGGIFLAAYDTDAYPPKLLAVRASLVGENGIEAGKTYRLTKDGDFEIVE